MIVFSNPIVCEQADPAFRIHPPAAAINKRDTRRPDVGSWRFPEVPLALNNFRRSAQSRLSSAVENGLPMRPRPSLKRAVAFTSGQVPQKPWSGDSNDTGSAPTLERRKPYAATLFADSRSEICRSQRDHRASLWFPIRLVVTRSRGRTGWVC